MSDGVPKPDPEAVQEVLRWLLQRYRLRSAAPMLSGEGEASNPESMHRQREGDHKGQ